MSFLDMLKRLLGTQTTDNGGGSPDVEMISCKEALSVINEFIDGELEEVSVAQVKAHFDVCKRCYPHLRLEESFREALHKAADADHAPEELRRKVSDLLADASGDD